MSTSPPAPARTGTATPAAPDTPFRQAPADVAAALRVDPSTGLTATDVERRRAAHGRNELAEPPRRAAWLRFADQFRSVLILVLIAAAILAGIVGDPKDTIVITIVLLINAIIGFVMENRAERSPARFGHRRVIVAHQHPNAREIQSARQRQHPDVASTER